MMVDEGCTCTVAEKSCYSSDPSTAGVGRCLAGVQRCEGEFYGDCEGEVEGGGGESGGTDNNGNKAAAEGDGRPWAATGNKQCGGRQTTADDDDDGRR